MSDYPMLISNKLHSFRNFIQTKTQWRSMNSTLPLLIADEIGGVPVGRGG